MRTIFQYLKYVFYRAFLVEYKRQGSDWIATLIAMFYVTFLLFLWALVVIFVLSDITGRFILVNKNGTLIFSMVFMILFYLVPHQVFVSGTRYKKIVEEFSAKHLTEKQTKIRDALVFANYILAFVLMTFFAALHQFL